MTASELTNLAGERIPNDNIYGVEWKLEGDGYSCDVVMSPINQRIQVLCAEIENPATFTRDLIDLAKRNSFGKVWIKARASQLEGLVASGFSEEGTIRGYFGPDENATIMVIYTDDERCKRPWIVDEDESLKIAGENLVPIRDHGLLKLPAGYTTRLFEPGDEKELAKLYAEVFPTYPYPVDDPAYLLQTAQDNIAYRLVFDAAGDLVAAASAETHSAYKNAEMTDFATLPSERGNGLGQYLLTKLEEDAQEIYGTTCYYTIARISMPGMVRIFLKNNYSIQGILTNNCSIAGQFETMVLMVKE